MEDVSRLNSLHLGYINKSDFFHFRFKTIDTIKAELDLKLFHTESLIEKRLISFPTDVGWIRRVESSYGKFNEFTLYFYYDDYFFSISQAGLRYIIKYYIKQIQRYYRNLTREEMQVHAKNRVRLWETHYRIIRRKNSDKLISKWNFELSVIELLRIYKTFNFNKNTLFIYSF